MTDYTELDKKRELAIALKRYHTQQLRTCFNPLDPDSKPTPQQDVVLREMKDVLFSWVQGGNQSGKSQLGGRVVSWFYQRNHPYINIDELWPDDPMVILVVGRLANQVEELWERKIKPFLQRNEWQENRQGGTLQYVTNRNNGSKIIFCTHNNPVEAREKLYSYSAHLVWFDELSDYLGIFEETQRRVQAKRGRMIVTFTPKIRAEAVRKFIETPTPFSKVYKISMLDNPIYDGRHDELLSQINNLPEQQRATILEGEWFVGERPVFSFDPRAHVELPPGYSTLWPHIVSVDPAASGLMGFSLWASNDLHAARWWCVGAEYLQGAAPSDLVEAVEEKVKGVQVAYRIFDPHEAWFAKQAQKVKIHYRGVPNKRGRKSELIQNLNQALGSGRVRLAPTADLLANELSICQWSETVEDKIVNASSYHLADTAQYFVDQMPTVKDIIHKPADNFDTQMWLANKQRLAKETQRKQGGTPKKPARLYMRRGSSLWTPF